MSTTTTKTIAITPTSTSQIVRLKHKTGEGTNGKTNGIVMDSPNTTKVPASNPAPAPTIISSTLPPGDNQDELSEEESGSWSGSSPDDTNLPTENSSQVQLEEPQEMDTQQTSIAPPKNKTKVTNRQEQVPPTQHQPTDVEENSESMEGVETEVRNPDEATTIDKETNDNTGTVEKPKRKKVPFLLQKADGSIVRRQYIPGAILKPTHLRKELTRNAIFSATRESTVAINIILEALVRTVTAKAAYLASASGKKTIGEKHMAAAMILMDKDVL